MIACNYAQRGADLLVRKLFLKYVTFHSLLHNLTWKLACEIRYFSLLPYAARGHHLPNPPRLSINHISLIDSKNHYSPVRMSNNHWSSFTWRAERSTKQQSLSPSTILPFLNEANKFRLSKTDQWPLFIKPERSIVGYRNRDSSLIMTGWFPRRTIAERKSHGIVAKWLTALYFITRSLRYPGREDNAFRRRQSISPSQLRLKCQTSPWASVREREREREEQRDSPWYAILLRVYTL